MSAIIGLFHHKMYSDSVSSDVQKFPWSKLLKMQPLMESLCDGVSSSLSPPSLCDRLRSGLYRLCHVPVACCQIIQQWPPPQMPQCAFWGEFKNHHKMAIGSPISINDFKSVAHSHGESVTVNDLFMTISHGALRRYAEKMKCPGKFPVIHPLLKHTFFLSEDMFIDRLLRSNQNRICQR